MSFHTSISSRSAQCMADIRLWTFRSHWPRGLGGLSYDWTVSKGFWQPFQPTPPTQLSTRCLFQRSAPVYQTVASDAAINHFICIITSMSKETDTWMWLLLAGTEQKQDGDERHIAGGEKNAYDCQCLHKQSTFAALCLFFAMVLRWRGGEGGVGTAETRHRHRHRWWACAAVNGWVSPLSAPRRPVGGGVEGEQVEERMRVTWELKLSLVLNPGAGCFLAQLRDQAQRIT